MKTVYGTPGCRGTGGGERREQTCHVHVEPCEGAMHRWRWIPSVVMVLALALCGCGSGGGVSMGGPDGDAGETSLLDRWRQFEDGAPTLRMTGTQVFDAWRSVARQSTHRVSLAVPLPGPVSIGSDPASPVPADTPPTFPVDAEACSPGDCDLAPPPEGTWAFAPVLGHNDVPVAEFTSRFTRTETLEAEDGVRPEEHLAVSGNIDTRFMLLEFFEPADTADLTVTLEDTDSTGLEEDRRGLDDRLTVTVLFDTLVDTLAYGGWLDYTHFNVSHTRWCMGGEPGCADIDDAETLFTGGGVLGFMAGRYAGTTPAGMGSAAWTGVMVGMEALPPALLGRERADVFLGDARITIDDLSAPAVDVSFTNIHNVTTGTRRRDLRWEGLRLEDGLFGTVSPPENYGERYDYLAGMFTGPGHQEVGGEFSGDGISGAFGARRQ